MNKQAFLEELKRKLSAKVNKEEVISLVQYYDGYIDEAIDFGMSEEEIISQLGDIDTLLNEITQGLTDENIDINQRNIMETESKSIIDEIDVDVKNTVIEIIYDDTIEDISVKVDKRFKQDYLVKTIDGVFRVKQIKSELNIGPGFVFNYSINDVEDGKKFNFGFDFDLKVRKIYIRIPSHLDIKTTIKTSNSSINIKEGNGKIQTETYRLITSNSHIHVQDMKIRNLYAKTSNAKITIDDVTSEMATLVTSNAKIDIHDALIKVIDAKTSNGKVEMVNVIIMDGKVKTSNGRILLSFANNNYGKRIRYATSNSKVLINNERYDNSGLYVNVSNTEVMQIELMTSNSRIEIIEA